MYLYLPPTCSLQHHGYFSVTTFYSKERHVTVQSLACSHVLLYLSLVPPFQTDRRSIKAVGSILSYKCECLLKQATQANSQRPKMRFLCLSKYLKYWKYLNYKGFSDQMFPKFKIKISRTHLHQERLWYEQDQNDIKNSQPLQCVL